MIHAVRPTVFLLAAGLSLVGAIGAAGVAQHRDIDAQRWVQHTSEVKEAISAARERLADEQASAPAQRIRRAIPLYASVREIRALTADNPAQQRRVDELDDALTNMDTEPAAPDRVRAILSEMRAEEQTLMLERASRLEAARRSSSFAFVLCAAMTLALGALAFLLLHRQSKEVRRARDDLGQKSRLLSSVVENIGDGIIAVDRDRHIVVLNEMGAQLTGQTAGSQLVTQWPAVFEADEVTPLAPDRSPMARALKGESVDGYQLVRKVNGSSFWTSTTARPIRDDEGAVLAAVSLVRDITDVKLAQLALSREANELRNISTVDELTGLLNRRGFFARAAAAWQAANSTGQPFAIVFLDLNGLKRVNDTLGHAAGDEMIRMAARAIRDVLREGDVAARLGGDELAILVPRASEETAHMLVERVRETRARTSRGDGSVLSASMGVSAFDPKSPRAIESLLEEADHRMYAHKRTPRTSLPPQLTLVRKGGTTKG